MSKPTTREMVAKARERLKAKSHDDIVVEDRFPAAEIHMNSGAGREIIKRIAAKEVDPKRCKPWTFHNRDSAWLSPENCDDLIKSIAKNGQQEPALVRLCHDDDGQFDYEIIYGVRRWYACSQIPNKKLLVKVTEADDKHCSILMHVENADSKDITELERAYSFAKQIKAGLFKNQKELADSLSLTKGHISKMISAAEIFEYDWVRTMFPSLMQVSLRNAYQLSLLLSQQDKYKKAKDMADKYIDSLSNGGKVMLPQQLMDTLLGKEQADSKSTSFDLTLLVVNGKPAVTARQAQNGKIMLIIDKLAKSLKKQDIEKEVSKVLDGFFAE